MSSTRTAWLRSRVSTTASSHERSLRGRRSSGRRSVCARAALIARAAAPSRWVARLAPAQSHCWRAYAEFLVRVGYRRVALITQPDRYWSTGAGILRAVLGETGVGVVSVDASATDAADAAAQLAEIGGVAAGGRLGWRPAPR